MIYLLEKHPIVVLLYKIINQNEVKEADKYEKTNPCGRGHAIAEDF